MCVYIYIYIYTHIYIYIYIYIYMHAHIHELCNIFREARPAKSPARVVPLQRPSQLPELGEDLVTLLLVFFLLCKFFISFFFLF